MTFLFLKNLSENEPILIILGLQKPKET